MKKIFFSFFYFIVGVTVYAQTADLLIIKDSISNLGIKNVNVLLPKNDTILVSDTEGVVDLSNFSDIDTLIIKKFGYKPQVLTENQRNIFLKKDKTAYSHNLKLLDLKHKGGYSLIKLSINGETYWFQQKVGMLNLGNGIEIETYQDYANIFQNHKIIKTVSVTTELCLWGIRGENYANWIMAIYYKPQIKKKNPKRIPRTVWYSKREARNDAKILKLRSGCLD